VDPRIARIVPNFATLTRKAAYPLRFTSTRSAGFDSLQLHRIIFPLLEAAKATARGCQSDLGRLKVFRATGRAFGRHPGALCSNDARRTDGVNAQDFHVDLVARACHSTLGFCQIRRRDGSESRVEFDSWEQRTFDPNDAVVGTRWLTEHQASASADDRRAATLALAHAGTPTVVHLDSLGRPFLSILHNKIAGIDDLQPTRSELDIEGNVLSITDARDDRQRWSDCRNSRE